MEDMGVAVRVPGRLGVRFKDVATGIDEGLVRS